MVDELAAARERTMRMRALIRGLFQDLSTVASTLLGFGLMAYGVIPNRHGITVMV